MTLTEKLKTIPCGRWATLKTTEGPVDLYHCDAEDGDFYLIEGGGRNGKTKSRVNLRDALHFLYHIIDDDDLE